MLCVSVTACVHLVAATPQIRSTRDPPRAPFKGASVPPPLLPAACRRVRAPGDRSELLLRHAARLSQCASLCCCARARALEGELLSELLCAACAHTRRWSLATDLCVGSRFQRLVRAHVACMILPSVLQASCDQQIVCEGCPSHPSRPASNGCTFSSRVRDRARESRSDFCTSCLYYIITIGTHARDARRSTPAHARACWSHMAGVFTRCTPIQPL